MANEDTLKRYLLGSLEARERSRIEEDYFANADFFEELVSTENDLIDSYVRGELPDAERQQFERQYAAKHQQDRLEFAKALARSAKSKQETIATTVKPSWSWNARFFPMRQPKLAWGLVFAAIVFGGLLGWQNRRLRMELRDAQAKTAQIRQEEASLHEQIATLGSKLERGGEASNDISQLEEPADLPFRILPGATRSGNVGNDLSLPRTADWIRLELVLTRDEFKTYEAVLQTPEGREVLRANKLTSSSSGGRRVVHWRIPSRSIPTGDYELRLSGQAAGGSVEEVESYSFRASRD